MILIFLSLCVTRGCACVMKILQAHTAMSGNGGNAASNAASNSASNAASNAANNKASNKASKAASNTAASSSTKEGETEGALTGDVARPSPSDVKVFRTWSNHIMYDDTPDGWTKLVVYLGIAARFGINAWLGTVKLDPRCRDKYCDFHAKGKQSFGVTCGRGQAGSGEFGVMYARGPIYATSDNGRANEYGQDAVRNDYEEKIGYVTLTCVVLIPTAHIYTTCRANLTHNPTRNRNFWWKHLKHKMIQVTDSIGNHITSRSSYDIALMDLSYLHIVRCIPNGDMEISLKNGLAWLPGHDGMIVVDAEKARTVGVFGTKEIAAEELAKSTKPWDLHDMEVAKVHASVSLVLMLVVLSVCVIVTILLFFCVLSQWSQCSFRVLCRCSLCCLCV